MSEHEVLAHVDDYLKIGGSLSPIWDTHAPLTAEDTERLARSFLNDERWEHLNKIGDVDFAYANDFGRFRASVIKQRLGYEIVFRLTKIVKITSSP